jgi:hypothetical protein
MKSTLVIEANSKEQINSLLLFLKEMGLKVMIIEDEKENQAISMVSEPSLAEAWNSKEDDRWDKIFQDK